MAMMFVPDLKTGDEFVEYIKDFKKDLSDTLKEMSEQNINTMKYLIRTSTNYLFSTPGCRCCEDRTLNELKRAAKAAEKIKV